MNWFMWALAILGGGFLIAVVLSAFLLAVTSFLSRGKP